MIGLGRMGGNIVRRLIKNGHTAVVYDKDAKAVAALAAEGATGANSLEDFVARLEKPRTAWVMLPAGKITEATIEALAPGRGSLERTRGREGRSGTTEEGYLLCGRPGAGHFVKMIHNGIECGQSRSEVALEMDA